MDHSNLIHDFVDGTLSSAEEGKLFSELAANGGLRSELKQFIEFERTARFDTDAYVPSAQTTASVFARVGIDNPAFNPVITANTGSGIVSLLSKYTQGIIGGVITAILTASVMYFAMNNDGISNNGTSTDNINTQKQNIPEKSMQASIPVMTSEEKEAPKIIEKVIIKYVPVEIVRNNQEEKPIATESQISNEDLIIESRKIDKSIINEIFRNQQISLNSYDNNTSFEQLEYEEFRFEPDFSFFDLFQKTGISIELAAGDYWTFPAPDIAKSSQAIFENKNLTLLYPISKSFHFGTEFRQESFYHNWNVPIDNKSYWQYKSNNNYYSAGVLL
jgi:hypothetical protein